MPYLGAEPTRGQFRKLSDISSGFNGSTTTFQLSVPPGTAAYYVTPASIYQLLISLGGVIQNPGTDYNISGSQITFTTAPATSLSFFGIAMGDPLNSNTPSDGTVGASKLYSSGSLVGQTFVATGTGSFTIGYAGASGAGGDQIFYENGQTVTTNYTLTTSKNAMTAGPITINSGIVVTIPSGSSWVIV